MTRIFLSYGREDEKSATRLHNNLKRAGYEIWFDKVSLIPGERWRSSIVKAIRAASAVVILLSKSSCNRSGFLNREIREALDVLDEQPGLKPFLIPVRLDNCASPHTELSALHRVDMFPDWIKGLRELRKTLSVVAPTRKVFKRNIHAFISVKVRSVDNVRALIGKILKIPKVVTVDLIIGSIDFMIVIDATTRQQLHDTIEAIMALMDVDETNTYVAIPSHLRSGIKSIRSRRQAVAEERT